LSPFLSLYAAVLLALSWLRRPALTLRGLVPFASVTALAAGGAGYWYYHRPQPAPAREALFQGVSYVRDVRTSPRPIVAHVVAIDLRAPRIAFVVTPEDTAGGLEVRADVTSRFLVRHGAQVAINGDFFLPWWSNGPQDYYPHVGEPVYVRGAAISQGREYGHREVPFTSLIVGHDGAVSIVETTDPKAPLLARYAISGKQLLIEGGARTPAVHAPDVEGVRHPRSAAAIDRSRRTLLLFAIDGRQPGYSEGVTLDELAGIVLDHGGWVAMNLDGGGSTSIAIDDGGGGARLLNCPIHTRIPWRERPVANHLGVFAAPL
jgi:hypothetical protein